MELFQVLSVPHRKIIFEDSCYLRAFVKSSKWTFSWKSLCWFDCYCNITVLLGLKAANGFWISLLFLPLSCYNVSSFEILGSTRALACVRTDVPPLSSLALLLIFSVGGGTFVHGSLVSTRYSFPSRSISRDPTNIYQVPRMLHSSTNLQVNYWLLCFKTLRQWWLISLGVLEPLKTHGGCW